MIDVCIEAETNCKNCGNPLMLNALSETIECPMCQTVANFPYQFWKENILESPLKEFSQFKDGEGQSQTNMTGEYTFRIMYGRQQPACRNCKTLIDLSKIDEYTSAGFVKCSKCSNEVSVRKLPAELDLIFDTIKYIVGEDADLIPSGKSGVAVPNAAKPILFTCPSCAGNLEIDGTQRMITCKYCSSEIYLPDALWLKLHPVKTIKRWYLLLDEAAINLKIPEWDHLCGIIAGPTGDVYFMGESEVDKCLIIWCMGNDLKTKWLTKEDKYDYSSTGFALSPDGFLYIYDRNKHPLLKLSCKDGSKAENPFNKILDCDDMIIDTDGSLFCLSNDKIIRYSKEGNILPVWSGTEDEGILGGISKLFHSISGSDNDDSEPNTYELKNRPVKIGSEYNFAALGEDGYIYFMYKESSDEDGIARYDKTGKKIWSAPVPMQSRYSKPYIDANGNIFILGDVDEKKNLIKYNKTTAKWETLIKHITEGGPLGDEEKFAISNDGFIYIADGYGALKIFDSNLKRVYISDQSKEDDEDTISDPKEGDDDFK